MEKNEHLIIKDYWKNLGESSGYKTFLEYKIDRDDIDVVWKKRKDMIFIEIEQTYNKNQIWKNMSKSLYLKPKLIIFDCKDRTIANYVISKKKKLNVPLFVINREEFDFERKKIDEIGGKIDNIYNVRTKAEMKIAKLLNTKKTVYCNKCHEEIKHGQTFLLNKDFASIHPNCD